MSRKIDLRKKLLHCTYHQLKEYARQEDDLEKAFMAQLILEERNEAISSKEPNEKLPKKTSPHSGFFTGCLAGASIMTIVGMVIIGIIMLAIGGVFISFLTGFLDIING